MSCLVGFAAFLIASFSICSVASTASSPTIPSFASCVDYRDYVEVQGTDYETTFVDDMLVHNGHAYLVTSSSLQLYDVSDPYNPFFVREMTLYGSGNDIAFDGEYAYVGVGGAEGLYVVDLDPEDPTIVGFVSNFTSYGVVVSGDYVFVSRTSNRLSTIDVSDPFSPQMVATASVGAQATWGGIVLRDDVLALGDNDRLSLIDVSDPLGVQVLGSVEIDGWNKSIEQVGNVIYAASIRSQGSLVAVDVEDPRNPTVISSLDINTNEFVINGVNARTPDEIVLSTDTGLIRVEVSDPARMELIDDLAIPTRSAQVVTFRGDQAYVGLARGGVTTVDFTNPDHIEPVDQILTSNAVASVSDGSFLYIADWSDGLKIADIRNAPESQVISNLDSPWRVERLALVNEYLFCMDDSWGLRVYDVRDPYQPRNSRGLERPGTVDIAAGEDVVYLGTQDSLLLIVDVSVPTDPVLVGELSLNGVVDQIDASGSFVYVAERRAGKLHIVDVGDPAAPMIRSTLALGANAWDVAVAGEYSYVNLSEAGTNIGATIVDISDPDAPGIVGSLPAFGTVKVSGDLAYSAYAGALRVLDVSNPEDPVRLGELYGGRIGSSVTLTRNHAFVSAGRDGVIVLPTCCSGLDPLRSALSLAPSLSREPTPSATALKAIAHPNPFTRSTTLRLELAYEAEVQVEVLTADGRRISNTDLGELAKGTHQVEVDGTALGIESRVGVRFLRVMSGDGSVETLRVIQVAGR